MFKVYADIQHVSGPLAGITIPDGWTVLTPTAEEAGAYGDWIDRQKDAGIAVDGGGGVRYVFASYGGVCREKAS